MLAHALKATTAAAALAALLTAAPAGASVITYSFDTPTGDLGPTHTYSNSSGTPVLTLNASGFNAAAGTGLLSTVDLYGKNDGGDEQGVGLTNDPSGQHEITPGSYIQFDVSNLIGVVSSFNVDIKFDSTTGGETWKIYGSNTALTAGATTGPGTFLTSGTTESMVALPTFGTYRYYDITSGLGNVLVSSLSATVPEPGTMAILTVGLIGLGAAVRRRRA